MRYFGDFVKELRINKCLTLRKFCNAVRVDPSNWSKIERNIIQPPRSEEILESIVKVLDIEHESEDWFTLYELATIASMDKSLIKNKSIIEKLPIFFRTFRSNKIDEEQLDDLIKLIKEN